jgi:integrase
MGTLTATKVKALTAKGRVHDGDGLYVQITERGSKSWIFRYMKDRRSHDMGLGPVELVSLAEARTQAFRNRQLLLEGVDPIQHAKAARRVRVAKEGPTFREFADNWIATREAGWRSEKHSAQWHSSLKTYVYNDAGKDGRRPRPNWMGIGDLPLSEISVEHVMQVLEPIWSAKPETANRVRNRMAQILDAAKARELRAGDNPAEWRGRLKHLLPAREKVRETKHHTALPYADLSAFMTKLRDRDSVSARALEFSILTAARTSEVIGAQWEEIDLKAKIWTIPGERMKSGREHRVPLSRPAVELLKRLPHEKDEDGYVFIGAKEGKPLSNMAMLELVRGMTG